MSRKDTIIIAVLINASLLAFLFVMAMRDDDETVITNPAIAQLLVEESKPHVGREIQIKNSDELDNVLKDLSLSELPQTMPIVEEEPVKLVKVKKEDHKYVEVSVKRGDVLSKIAQANGTTVESIKKANHLTSEKLNVGQTLKIPVSDRTIAEKKSAAVTLLTKTEIEPEYYVIKSGDNPWKIAKQLHLKYEDLLKLNNLDEERARNMKIGDRIRIK